MSEPRWDALGKKVEPGWGPERDRSARATIAERTTQRRALKRAAASVAALVLVAGAAGAVVRLRTSTAAGVPAAPSVSAPVKLRAPSAVTEIAPGDQPELSVPASPSPSALEEPRPAPASPISSGWRPLAESGRYDEARTALKKAGPNAVRDETADLLLAADAARLGGYPAEAVPYLERVVRAHASDPRSSLASFTLGRVLLDELGRPREAADAFARARAAGGPLAEDALAREVEAASRAGDTSRSRELAREYQKRYPNGRRAKAVSRFGGLD
jgi:transmembrane sensor